MTTEELKKIYSPEESELHNAQMNLLDLLCKFDLLCKKNNINYFLGEGSLLGAIRHQGFIPWDDDIDLVMFPDDYKKLLKYIDSNNIYPLLLHTLKNDYNYPFVYSKFRDEHIPSGSSNPQRAKKYKYNGIGIDIFPLELTNTLVSRICGAIYSILVTHLTYKIKYDSVRFVYTRCMQYLLLKILFPLFNLPVKLLGNKDEYHFALGTPWWRVKLYKSKFFPPKMSKFEDKEFLIPNDSDSYLRSAYGNYMKLPSQDEILSTIHNSKYREEIITRLNI